MPGAPTECMLDCYPVLSLHGLLCKFVSRSDVVLISFWMLTIPGIFWKPISFYRHVSRFVVFQASGALLFLLCSHENAVAHMNWWTQRFRCGSGACS